MTDKKPIIAGEKPKITITMEPISATHTLDTIDWCVEYFASRGRITIAKRECERVDENSYAMRVDTTKLGIGPLLGILYPNIPDSDMESGVYTPPVPFDTGEIIATPYYMRDGLCNN